MKHLCRRAASRDAGCDDADIAEQHGDGYHNHSLTDEATAVAGGGGNGDEMIRSTHPEHTMLSKLVVANHNYHDQLTKRVEALEARMKTLEQEQQQQDDPNQLILDVGGQLFPTSRDDIARTNPGSLLHTNFCGRHDIELKEVHTFFIDDHNPATLFPSVLAFVKHGPSAPECNDQLQQLYRSELMQLDCAATELYQLPLLSEAIKAIVAVRPPVYFIRDPDNINVDALTMTIATKSTRGSNGAWNSFVHGEALSMDEDIVTFSFKLLNVGSSSAIMVGVAPAAITTVTDRSYIFCKCGWYLSCHSTTLCSGPPTKYDGKEYGTKERLIDGCEVKVTVQRSNGTISFAINGEDRGVAYEGVFSPNDMLYPCVALAYFGQSVQLI